VEHWRPPRRAGAGPSYVEGTLEPRKQGILLVACTIGHQGLAAPGVRKYFAPTHISSITNSHTGIHDNSQRLLRLPTSGSGAMLTVGGSLDDACEEIGDSAAGAAGGARQQADRQEALERGQTAQTNTAEQQGNTRQEENQHPGGQTQGARGRNAIKEQQLLLHQ
jgi:hypothetical protein